MSDSLIKTVTTKQTDKVEILQSVESLLIDINIISQTNNMLRDIEFREQKGNIEVYPSVLLPHIKAPYIKESQIVLIKNNDTAINWDNNPIELIIMVLVSELPDDKTQEEIKAFMKNLADEKYIKKLMIKE
jgi:mannitol/fructose-specific phosphotransferase system IIA component (Ntr-type)